MNLKQKQFTERYAIILNAAKAYMEVYGSSLKSAQTNGPRLIRNDQVQDYLKNLVTETSTDNKVELDNVIQEVSKIAFSNITTYINPDGSLNKDKILEDKNNSAISEFLVIEKKTKYGINKTYRLKMHNKLDALIKLGMHLGGFKTSTRHEVGLTLEQILTKSWENEELNQ